ncbi:hypothetical protein HYU72_00930 [Candidatus Berkelbacteria bacterium]|nr:hypothetical protein [Candidatus Berkelbacteria bacterium]
MWAWTLGIKEVGLTLGIKRFILKLRRSLRLVEDGLLGQEFLISLN